MADFSIEGIAETVEMLKHAPQTIVAVGFAKGFDAAAQVMEEAIWSRAPERDEGERDEEVSHLRDNIVHAISIDSRLRGGSVDVGFGKLGHKALWVEYGHRMVGHAPGLKLVGQVMPHPFIRPAFDASKVEAVEAFANALQSALLGVSG